LLAWLPTFVWMGVIATESTAIFTSDRTYGWIFRLFRALMGADFALRHTLYFNEYGRKLGHFTGYGILSFLSFFGWTALLTYHRQAALDAMGKAVKVIRRWHLRAAGLAVLLTF